MSLHALFIGCNYRGENCELPDCELDAENLAAALEPYIATGRELLSVSRAKMLSALAKLKATMKPGDVAIISFSGHGTTDIINGKPQQGIVTNDLQIIYEFELRQLLADLGQAVFIADSCFAGGLIRGSGRKQRWIPASHCFRREVTPPTRLPKNPHATYMACKAGETAASTGEGGAFTLALLEAFDQAKERTTFSGLHKAIRKLLPNKEYSQTPQFACAAPAFANRTLKSFVKKWNKKPA